MSWMEKLWQTYDACVENPHFKTEEHQLTPIGHTVQQSHIEIVIDRDGNFREAKVEKLDIVLPATEESAGRTSGGAAHGLSDKIQYCAQDYKDFGGHKTSYFDIYIEQLNRWCQSPNCHPKAEAVHKYVSKGKVVSDLVAAHVLVVDETGKLLDTWESEEEPPAIFQILQKKKEQGKSIQDQGDALVRWTVEAPGEEDVHSWRDVVLQQKWLAFLSEKSAKLGLCYLSGERTELAEQHPAKLRHNADKAKLISSNDTAGFTFRGRFAHSDEACGIGAVETQKAHSALQWLIRRQSTKVDDQIFVAWAVSGKTIPNPLDDTENLFAKAHLKAVSPDLEPVAGANLDVGQTFATKLGRAIHGYSSSLSPSDDIVLLGLDSATPGRMAILYYRQLKPSEFLARLEAWHAAAAWILPKFEEGEGKKKKSLVWKVSAPSPIDIAIAAYGRRLDDKLKKNTFQRLVPCIIDGQPLPRDLVISTFHRATNRVGQEEWQWQQCLSVACALYRCQLLTLRNPEQRREYSMTLQEDINSRDYLFGRLLALAEKIEDTALSLAGESRPTMAAKLMQRFAERPVSTWRSIETSLEPYKARVRSRFPGYLVNLMREMDEVYDKFDPVEFSTERKLSGEFLLGYHCQRQKLRRRKHDPQEPIDTQDQHVSNLSEN